MEQKLYSIKVNGSGRYITYCDDCWYETSEAEFPYFTKEQAEKIRKQLKSHYVYNVTISNGDEVLAEEKPKAAAKKASGWNMGGFGKIGA